MTPQQQQMQFQEQQKKAHIQQRDEQIAILKTKIEGLENIRDGYEDLSSLDWPELERSIAHVLGAPTAEKLISGLSSLFAGYFDFYQLELETIEQIQAKWAEERARLTSPIATAGADAATLSKLRGN